jgi:hypothetical protein
MRREKVFSGLSGLKVVPDAEVAVKGTSSRSFYESINVRSAM